VTAAGEVAWLRVAVDITLFTDPACPFAFSAEPNRQRLRWYYGDQLRWRLNMIVLTLEPGEDAKLAEGAPGLQRLYGMPINPHPYARTFSSEPACRAVVAARLNAPGAEAPLLRRLRVRAMLGGLLDDPALLAAAAADVGLDPADVERWSRMPAVEDALRADIDAARSPSPAARRLDHKLGGPTHERRYTAPSYELTSDGRTFSIPGFNPIEAYEAAMANFGLTRRAKPESVEQVLAWASEPLATVEVIAIMQGDAAKTRAALARAATPIPAGADFYWTTR
jgi:predicted DsbA family dithiol-disulfide isomerase